MRFSYIKYDETSMKHQQTLKAKFEELEALVNELGPGRPQSLCLTCLEEAYMWTGKAIRDNQISREGKCKEQAERGDE